MLLQAFQSIALCLVTSAPWYISNDTLHNDLKIETLLQIPLKTVIAPKPYNFLTLVQIYPWKSNAPFEMPTVQS